MPVSVFYSIVLSHAEALWHQTATGVSMAQDRGSASSGDTVGGRGDWPSMCITEAIRKLLKYPLEPIRDVDCCGSSEGGDHGMQFTDLIISHKAVEVKEPGQRSVLPPSSQWPKDL